MAIDNPRLSPSARRRIRGLGIPILIVLFVATFGIAIKLKPGGDLGLLRLDDLGQLAIATTAAIATGWAAKRASGRLRASWVFTSLGTAGWAAGQVVWCWYELVQHRDAPFPSPADAGYLLFPIGAAVGLWAFPTVQNRVERWRWLLDGALVGSALIAVSWSATLGVTVHAGGDGAFAMAVSLAYPVGDILILTMAVTALCRPTAHRRQLVLLSLAMAAMAISDSSFTYLTATGRYVTGGWTDLGWVAAFGMLAIAGANSVTHPQAESAGAAAGTDAENPAGATMLPYLPLLVAGVVLGVGRSRGHQIDGVELSAVTASLIMVLARQYSTIGENRALLRVLALREEQLKQQVFQDNLTGLANRALFINRVQHALDLHRRDLRPLAVLFCDLDDFKSVNDTFGHGSGDELLIKFAERLRGMLRPGDTLARLGGDEFAILIEDGGEPTAVAARIVEALRIDFVIAGNPLTIGASVGVAELRPHEVTPTMDVLLAWADTAMYVAKRGGKGQLALYDPKMTLARAEQLQPVVQTNLAADDPQEVSPASK